MNSSEESGVVIMSDKQLSKSFSQKQGDLDYDDDFEDADPNIKEASKDPSSPASSPKASGRKDVFHSHSSSSDESEAQQEKGQLEASDKAPTEKSVQPDDDSARGQHHASPHEESQSDESEPESEEDPPEYNVKERLKELNAELASEPDPDNRQHRVGFKPELVDLVAPPPEVSDDEETPGKGKEKKGDDQDTSKRHVIERSGKFEVVDERDLTADERSMLNLPDEDDSVKNQPKQGGGNQHNQHHSHQPAPPSKPRPATANGNTRRGVNPATSQRPKTASQARPNESYNALHNFDYKSRYAMSPSEKKKAQEQSRLREQRRKEEENRKKKEEEEKQQEAHECFMAWLKRKKEEKRQENEKNEDRKKREAPTDKSVDSESQENEKAFHEWLKIKHNQHKKEKLLKKREEQEINDGYYVRSREECDKAYKEWLKKKYAELKEKKVAEKQKYKSYRVQARRARKQMMMARAVRQSQAFRYVDYYGYRF